MVLAFTCLTNYSESPYLTSLGEQLVLAPGHGAMAVWGPSGFSIDPQAVQLGSALLPGPAPVMAAARIGDLVRSAVAAFRATGGSALHR